MYIVITSFHYGLLNILQRVTPWNAGKLRDAVVNGPDVHPGATTYVDSVTTVKLPASKKMRVAISRKLPSSRGVVMQSGKYDELEFEGKIVYRHLQDGDIVLVNRQVRKMALLTKLFVFFAEYLCMSVSVQLAMNYFCWFL